MQVSSRTLALSVGSASSVQYTFGPEEILGVSGSAYASSSKPYRWPDSSFGIMPSLPSEPEPFTCYGSTQDGVLTYRTSGPLDQPTKRWPSSGVLHSTGVPAEYRYSGGGPIYQLTPDKWLLFVESEVHRNFGGKDVFHNRLSVHKSADRGATWAWLGDTVESQAGYGTSFTSATCNMGDGNYCPVTVGGVPYLYTFFNDFAPSGPGSSRTTMARVRVADLLTWFDGGPRANYLKWDGSGFTLPAIGPWPTLPGLGAPLILPSGLPPSGPPSAPKVAFNTFLGRYIMGFHGYPTNTYPDSDNYFIDSADLITWKNPVVVGVSTPGRTEAKSTFCRLDGSAQHDLGKQFWIYYLSAAFDRNVDDTLRRRLVEVA